MSPTVGVRCRCRLANRRMGGDTWRNTAGEVDEMDATRSREFFTGLHNIEREIIAKLRERGVPVTAANFKWNRGRGVFGSASEQATLEINVHGTLAKAVFSREQSPRLSCWCRQDGCRRLD
jgi:hypothetical protein